MNDELQDILNSGDITGQDIKQETKSKTLKDMYDPRLKRRGRAGTLKSKRKMLSPKSAFKSHNDGETADQDLVPALER